MRLGAPLPGSHDGPDQWAEAVRGLGYGAAYCPVGADADSDTLQAYVDAARAADIVIAEVGAWSNPLSPDASIREAALDTCRTALACRACRP